MTKINTLTAARLRRMALPDPEAGSKDKRGRVLVVGGSRAMPGAVLLAATAALRAGAGKLQIATVESVAAALAVAVPESYVVGLPETKQGAIDPESADILRPRLDGVDCVLFGPGMIDEPLAVQFINALLPHIGENCTVVLDAAALAVPSENAAALHGLGGRVVLTPHGLEASLMLHLEQHDVERDAPGTALRAAADLRAVVALKGVDTFVASPDGRLFANTAGHVGLATSGSGDALAGIIAGLCARGAEPLVAACWGVHVHARAGETLAKRVGPLGFLAREILSEVPTLLHRLGEPAKRGVK